MDNNFFSPKQSPPVRAVGQRHVLGLTSDPLPKVRIAIIGLGIRGTRALKRLPYIDNAYVTAVCDISYDNIKRSVRFLKSQQLTDTKVLQGADAWKKICELPDVDLVYICTDWKSHTPIAVYAMQCGKHVCIEVPAASTVDECWQLVNAAECSRRHCMMLENCCYDVFELAVMNMVRQGLLGEIIHLDGAYIHDLRGMLFGSQHVDNIHWQLEYFVEHTGNPYPTHGVGPLCQLLDIHRKDQLSHLVSMSTSQVGLSGYAMRKYGSNSAEALKPYLLGDMNTTIIRTQKGKTITLQHDICNPRPYERTFTVSGTQGFARKYPIPPIAIEPSAHRALTPSKTRKLIENYAHPYVLQWAEKAHKLCGNRARDYIMDARLIHCLHLGLPLDQDVYDAVEWSCLTELTEISVLSGSLPVDIPDFTRGDWSKFGDS